MTLDLPEPASWYLQLDGTKFTAQWVKLRLFCPRYCKWAATMHLKSRRYHFADDLRHSCRESCDVDVDWSGAKNDHSELPSPSSPTVPPATCSTLSLRLLPVWSSENIRPAFLVRHCFPGHGNHQSHLLETRSRSSGLLDFVRSHTRQHENDIICF